MNAAPAPSPRPVTLDDFLLRLRSTNPFTDNRVNGPAPDDGDVPEVHAAAFGRLTSLAEEACAERRGLGAVLWGEAGVGKSHVLARLARWADDGGRACFVYLHNLQAGPEFLPRSLLRAVVSILTLGRARGFRGTPLFRLVASFAHEAFDYSAHPSRWEEIRPAYERLVDRLSAADPSHAALADRTVYDVLFEFFHSAWREANGQADGVAGLAARWLAGDGLDPHQARQLGLPGGPARHDPVALRDNQQVKQVLVALTRLALGRKQPFLLCFDQVDNLDEEQAASLARFLEALLDSSPNLLAVTAGVQATLLGWRERKVIQDSAWDRLAQFEVSLQRVGAREAERIVAARLGRFLEPFRGLAEVRERLREDALFPLGSAWRAENLDGKADLRPRDVLSKAGEGWRRQQKTLRERGGVAWLERWGAATEVARPVAPPTDDEVRAAIDAQVSRKMAEQQARREAQPHTLPWDADHLTGLTAALLDGCRQANPSCGVVKVERMTSPKGGSRPSYDLAVRVRGAGGKEATAGVLFLATTHATSAAAGLRRAVHERRKCDRFFLVTDARSKLTLGLKGQEHLERLRQGAAGEFRHVELTFAEYAALDALQAAVGLARSGDLEIEFPGQEPRRVTEAEVIASHDRRGRYRAAPLLRELLPS